MRYRRGRQRFALWGFWVILGFYVQVLQAQNTIKGKVYESITNDQGKFEHLPLPGAYVEVKGRELAAATDAHGFFKLKGVFEGDTLVATMVGYTGVGLVYEGQVFLEMALTSGVELGQAEVIAQDRGTSFSLIDPLNAQVINRKELVKAACCNLSEAFETNASVDASFTDAVTGTRQIRMLGLDGKYTQIQVDNLPGPRGLSAVLGLTFIPGDWVESIQISKGAGSVTGGHESMTGQINVAMKNPMNADPLHVNLYSNASGRVEWNHISVHSVGRKWKTTLLSHALYNGTENDRNADGFLDTPLQRHLILRNEWKYQGDRSLRGEYAVTGIRTEVMGGQTSSLPDGPLDWSEMRGALVHTNPLGWSAFTSVSRMEWTAKTGYVFPLAEWRSLGSQFSWIVHEQQHRFGEKAYDGRENHFRGNLLLNDILGNTNHKYAVGVSYERDDFDEELDVAPDTTSRFVRTEHVPGVFLEYTWNHQERLNVILGARWDHHNMYGSFFSPRLHARWSLREELSLKFAAGRGWRTPNVFMEQLGSWASQRVWQIEAGERGFAPEMSTNVGLNLTSKFTLNYREASLAVDLYRTEFENRLVVDLENPSEVQVYALLGQSLSTSAQVEFDWSVHRRVDLRLAYRYVEAHTDRITRPEETWDPFVPRHRAFTQMSWASRLGEDGSQSRIDLSAQWVGEQRLPSTAELPSAFQRPEVALGFVQLNVQWSRDFSDAFGLYFGVENVTNVKQFRPILGAEYNGQDISPQEFDAFFDASLVYGPIFGRMMYGGLRWRIPSAA
ncbi:MAG: TonB-dependent receptor [Flavobacteriales bacterium]